MKPRTAGETAEAARKEQAAVTAAAGPAAGESGAKPEADKKGGKGKAPAPAKAAEPACDDAAGRRLSRCRYPLFL